MDPLITLSLEPFLKVSFGLWVGTRRIVYIIHDVPVFSPGGFFRYQLILPNLAPEIHKICLKTENLSPDPPNNYFLLHFWAIIF